MTEEDALLLAVRADPANDAPRLVYADWLDDNHTLVKKCGGSHRHEGKVGQVIHGLLHETDPRLNHHHCDDRCQVSDGRAEYAEFIRVSCHTGDDMIYRGLPELLKQSCKRIADRYQGRYGTTGGQQLKDCYEFTGDYGQGSPGVRLRIKRGFVWEVESTLEVFIGEACSRCRHPLMMDLLAVAPMEIARYRRLLIPCPHCDVQSRSSCRHCRDRRELEMSELMPDADCKVCSGSGRMNSIAASAFGRQPVQSVVLADRQPYYPSPQFNNGRDEYIWFGATPTGQPGSNLGPEVFRHLGGRRRTYHQRAEFHTQAEARSAVNLAAVRFARHIVNLPALTGR